MNAASVLSAPDPLARRILAFFALGPAADMVSTRLFRHQDYELQCSATGVDGGRFVPGLVVSRQSWPRRPRVIAVQRGEHGCEETAIDAARVQGLAWIRDYG